MKRKVPEPDTTVATTMVVRVRPFPLCARDPCRDPTVEQQWAARLLPDMQTTIATQDFIHLAKQLRAVKNTLGTELDTAVWCPEESGGESTNGTIALNAYLLELMDDDVFVVCAISTAESTVAVFGATHRFYMLDITKSRLYATTNVLGGFVPLLTAKYGKDVVSYQSYAMAK